MPISSSVTDRINLRNFAVFFVLAFLANASSAFAQAEVPQYFTLDGRLFEAGSTSEPLLDGSVVLTVQILNPAKTCILYEETETVSTLSTNGYFTARIGSATGAPERGARDSNNSMTTVFVNAATPITGQTSGGGGCVYNPASRDAREFRFFITPSTVGGTAQLSDDMTVDSVPQALVAQTLQGLGPSNVFQTSVTSTQAKLDNLLTTNYTTLTDVISGTSTLYLQNSAVGTQLPTRATDPGAPSPGQIWYDTVTNEIKYYNGSTIEAVGTAGPGVTSVTAGAGLSGGTITTSGTIAIDTEGVATAMIEDGAVTNVKLASGIDAAKVTTGTLPAGVVPTGTDNTKLPLDGSVAMTGALDLGANNVLNTGHITMNAQRTMTVGRYDAGQQVTLIGTLAAPNAGATWYNTTTGKLMYWNGSAALEVSESTTAGGDITAINTNAGSGLTGGVTSGPATLAVNVDGTTLEVATNTVQVKDAGIDANKLAANAVTTAKIADDAVTSGKILNGEVTDAKINTVSVNKISSALGQYFTYAPNGGACGGGAVLKKTVNGWECDVDIGVTDHGALTGLGDDDHTQYVMLAGRGGGQNLIGGTASGDDLTIESTSDATKGFVLLQPNGGSVGIGTNNPAATFHVVGGQYIGDTRYPYLEMTSNHATSGDSGISLSGATTVNNGVVGYINGLNSASGSGVNIASIYFQRDSSDNDGSITFRTKPTGTAITERMRISSNGNVGIGTTSPLYLADVRNSTGLSQIHVSGTGADSGLYLNSISPGNATIAAGYAWDGSDAIAKNISLSSMVQVNGTFLFYSATGQTIGAPATLTERMRINTSGNVGIGTSNPTVSLDFNTRTDAVRLPAGTTAQQPAGANGMIRYNTTNNKFEGYENGGWVNLRDAASNTTITAAAGSVGAPSLSFNGDPDTGFYDALSNDTISIATGGAKIFDLSSTGLVSPTIGGGLLTTGNGTAAAPTFSFAGDTDTGWFRAAADTLAASTAGVERVRIDSSGNVGIGTTNPTSPLHIVQPSTTGIKLERSGFKDILISNAGQGLNVFNSTDSAQLFQIIASTGNVGIGTVTPQAKLDISSGTNPALLVGADDGATTRTDSSDKVARIGSAHYTNAEEPFTLLFGQSTSTNNYITIGGGTANLNSATNIVFNTASNNTTLSGAERMRIDSSGNVGIGTNNPAQLLHVNSALGNANLLISGGFADGISNLLINTVGDASASRITFQKSLVTQGSIAYNNAATGTAQAMNFDVAGGSAEMTILGSGNVGIGTTNPGYGLDVSRSSSNIYAASSSSAVTPHVANDPVLRIRNLDSTLGSGAYLNFQTLSGGATNAISYIGSFAETNASTNAAMVFGSRTGPTSYSEYMRISPSGNVGIGTTDPGSKLDVRGSGAAMATLYRDDTTDDLRTVVAVVRRRSDATAPLAGLGGSLQYNLEGFTDGSTVPAGLIGVLWENDQTNDTTDRDSAMKFNTTLDGSIYERVRISSAGNVGIGTANPTVSLDFNTRTDAVRFPAGTTAQQPAGANGMIRYNTTNNKFEGYENGGWVNLRDPSSNITVTAATGTAAAPSLSFTGEADTGFYNSGTNSIGVATNGALLFDFNTVGLVSPTTGGASILSGDGTAATPTYGFAGDTDTGWFRPAADTLAASTGGTERVRISATGNVGIGTTAPGEVLHIQHADTTDTYGGLYVRNSASSTQSWSGIGIGNNLGVTGYLWAGSDTYTGTVGQNRMVLESTGTAAGLSLRAVGAGDLRFLNNSSERMRIDSTGRVSIGTTSTTANLEVQGSTGVFRVSNSTSADNVAVINSSPTLGAYIHLRRDGANEWMFGSDPSINGLTFRAGSTASTPLVTFLTSGHVGIGTTAPFQQLVVHKSTGSPSMAISSNGTGTNDSLTFSYITKGDGGTPLGNAATNGWLWYSRSDAYTTVPSQANDLGLNYYNGTTVTNALYFDSAAGNLGIGTTAPTTKLEVSGGVAINGVATALGTTVGSLKVFAGADGSAQNAATFNYSATNTSGVTVNMNKSRGTASAPLTVDNLDSVGTLRFRPFDGTNYLDTARVSAEVNGAVSTGVVPTDLQFLTGSNSAPSEKMRILSTGNVGIGTSAPMAQTEIYGAGQTTAALADGGNTGGMLALNSTGALAGNGGAILFGNVQSKAAGSLGMAAIKGLLVNGAGNTVGDIAFSTRAATGDTALTERMRITYSGNIGIATTSPGAQLDINTVTGGSDTPGSAHFQRWTINDGPAGFGWRHNAGLNTIELDRNSSSTWSAVMAISRSTGNIGIGTSAPSAKLDVAGTTKLGTAGVAFSSMGGCTIPSFTISAGANTRTCTGLPAGAAVYCSPNATQGGSNPWGAWASAADTVTINIENAGNAAVWKCMWMVP